MKKKIKTKKQKILINRLILVTISVITIYALFFNNALSFLTEVGFEKTNTLRVSLGIIGLFFSIWWTAIKSSKGEL